MSPERSGGRDLSRLRRQRTEAREPQRESRRRSASRLDQPLEAQRTLVRRPTMKDDAFGTFAEQFARFMGTARFLLYMTLFVVVWILWNTLAPSGVRFDAYAFIFLTLILSLQASYAAPLILLAQNRQEQRDRVVGEQDRQANARGHADMEYLAREVASLRMALGEVTTRDYLRSELRSLLAELDERREGGEEAADETGESQEYDAGTHPDTAADRQD